MQEPAAKAVDGNSGPNAEDEELTAVAKSSSTLPRELAAVIETPAFMDGRGITKDPRPKSPCGEEEPVLPPDEGATLSAVEEKPKSSPPVVPVEREASQQQDDPLKGAQRENYVQECSSCTTILSEDNTPKRKVTCSCKHPLETCLECLSKYIASKMTQATPDQIQCPACVESLDFAAIQDFADKATFEKYDKILYNRYLANELGQAEKFQECRNPDCKSGQICSPDKDSYIICRECQASTCIKCDAAGHPGKSCAEKVAEPLEHKAARDTEAAKGQEYVRKTCKHCPKCDCPGIKVVGCDHIDH